MSETLDAILCLFLLGVLIAAALPQDLASFERGCLSPGYVS